MGVGRGGRFLRRGGGSWPAAGRREAAIGAPEAQGRGSEPRGVRPALVFSVLDVQTRQLMENELLELWSSDRRSVVFITHDLEEAIALSDRVVLLSAGPRTRPIGDFRIDLPRPRDVAEIRASPRFSELHVHIWRALRAEVLRAYAQSEGRA